MKLLADRCTGMAVFAAIRKSSLSRGPIELQKNACGAIGGR
jgi:hypothetical protein